MNIRVEDNNLLDYSDWINNITGSTLMFNNNGGTFSKNYIEINNDPFNNNNYVWNSTIQSGATAHSSAGWNTDNIIIEPGVNYRYSQWVKRKNNSVSRVYFGCAAYGSDNNPRYLKYAKNGFIDTGYGGPMYNVNFTSSAWLPDEQWVLINYAILNSGSTTGSTLYDTGIWNSGGTKTTAIFNDMIVTSGTTQIQLRYYGPYVVTTGAAHFQTSYPRIDIIDGTEPSINTLLQNEGMWRSGTTYIKVEDNNLVDHSDWYTPITGNTANVVEQIRINASYVSSKNYIENDIGPHGIEVPIWKTQGFATGYTAGIAGTYDTSISLGTIVDNTKIYRLSLWVNRKDIGTNGLFYFGYNVKVGANLGNSIRINDGLVSSNFYFVSQNFTQAATTLPENNWVLAVGYLLPSTYTGSTDANYYTKIYNTSGTELINGAQNYKMSGNTTGVFLRCYTPYNETTWSGTTSWLYNPRIDLVDGTEPSINTLLNNEGMWRSGTTMIYVDDVWKNTFDNELPIYWGTYTGRTVDEQYILNNFQSEIENIGSPDGKLRHFLPTGYTHSFFAIPDINIGEKIVNIITYNQIPNLEDKCNPLNNVILTYYYTDYQYYQSDPEPDCQEINYGKIIINNYNYRLYRTFSQSSSNSLWIYSF